MGSDAVLLALQSVAGELTYCNATRRLASPVVALLGRFLPKLRAAGYSGLFFWPEPCQAGPRRSIDLRFFALADPQPARKQTLLDILDLRFSPEDSLGQRGFHERVEIAVEDVVRARGLHP